MTTRKDKKGRNLRQGESHRSDGRYDYRYTDNNGKRHIVYASDLKELRKKEEQIQRDLLDGIQSGGNEITLLEQFQNYIELKNYKKTTLKTVNKYVKFLQQYPIATKKINQIRQSDCRKLLISFNQKYSDSTTKHLATWLKASLDLAVADDLIRKNPFDFDYKGLINHKPKVRREGLTDEEFDSFIAFLKTKNHWIIPHTIFLRETGLRISEFLGLSVNDFDFENHLLTVERQLLKDEEGHYFYISEPKTKESKAKIPLSPLAEQSARDLMAYRPNTRELDGVSGLFILGKRNNCFLRQSDISKYYSNLTDEYNALHRDHPIKVTPHVLRHTTATHYIRMGMNPVFVQRLMRHTNPTMTLQVYTHINENDVLQQMRTLMK